MHDVNTIETLREQLMSDRSTQMPLEKKIPFAGGGGEGVLTTFAYGDVRAIFWVRNLACKPYFWVRNFTQELPMFWG